MMDLILSWLCSAFAKLLEEIAEFFTGLFGYDITTFNNTFAFAATAYDIMRKTGLALALIIAAWQVIVFFTRGAEKAPATRGHSHAKTSRLLAYFHLYIPSHKELIYL